jgi:hypothetical protein
LFFLSFKKKKKKTTATNIILTRVALLSSNMAACFGPYWSHHFHAFAVLLSWASTCAAALLVILVFFLPINRWGYNLRTNEENDSTFLFWPLWEEWQSSARKEYIHLCTQITHI